MLATLQAWRERGDDRLDPVGFHFIEALARRAAAHAGAARARLNERLAQLLQAYAARIAAANAETEGLDDAAAPDASPAPATPAPKPARGPLAELAAYLAYPGAPGEDPDAIAAQARRDAYPDLPVLDGLREIWSGLSADRQVRQSQEQVHKNAGPLNSNQLVHRALSLMRELSPGYLQQFVTYTETLAWMEQVTAAAAPPAKEAPRAPAKKNTRAKRR
ncbi:MAG: DUF2894 domain-containing protein [Achromobacter sp.]|uniref:DUF2894 domain-containing protein n=1 Tax=Achromobacter sp. TaxID=134375 RepID=UPI003D0436A0